MLACGLAATAALGARQGSPVLRSGDDLQAAINRARPGDVLRLEAGATFTGNFELPAHGGTDVITIRTAVDDRRLPASRRVGPQQISLMPTIAQRGSEPALRTAPGASHWQIIGVRFQGSGSGDLVTLGDGGSAQNSYALVPKQLTLDRVVILGDEVRGQKRGIALNSGATTIRNSHVGEIKQAGQETQAIAGWNGPGPFLIENNHLEAAGINILFGGAESSIGGLVPSDIVVRRNTLVKPEIWRNQGWTVKNLLELKNARRVLVEGNVMERNWADAQVGYAILFTVRASGPRSSWATVEDVTFQNNLVQHVASGINILGYDDSHESQQARQILIRNNLFTDVDHERWGGNGTFLQVGDEPADIVVEHNTVLQSGNLVTAYGGSGRGRRPIRGFRFAHNIGRHNEYGILGDSLGVGLPAIQAYFPDSTIVGNVLAGGDAARYPPGNLFPSVADLMAQFVNPAGGDHRLKEGSRLRSAGGNGRPVGVDHDELFRALAGLGLGLR